MKRICEIILMTAVILILWSKSRAETQSASFMADPVTAIAVDYQAGRLSLDDKAILQITAIKKPDDLPEEYRLHDSLHGRSHTRGITSAIAEIVSVWDQLRPETQASLAAMLARPVMDTTYRSPSGFFLLHYDTTGE
ncbi:MAG: hypothetical protein JSU65_01070, partial [Candidatus Zixiibacteriota bacterium]